MPDVIITGLPRSGATVAAGLVDYLPNAACLNSPASQFPAARRLGGALSFAKWIAGDFAWHRVQLLAQKPVRDFRAADGAPLLDRMKDPRRVTGEDGRMKPVLFTRSGLTGDFILGMKHHVPYTAILPALTQFDFKILAVIRHPLDVMLSWQGLGKPVIARGKPPGIGKFWPEAMKIARGGLSTYDSMAQLYDLHLQRYHDLREHIHIVKYEDMIADPMSISRWLGKKKVSAAASMIESRPRLRRPEDVASIREALGRYGVFTKLYYEA